MREREFKEWMVGKGHAPATVSTRISDARRIETHYGDLDAAYEEDRFASILESLTYSSQDRDAGKPNPSRLNIDGDLYASLGPYRSVLSVYAQFRADSLRQPTQADRIRGFVIAHYVNPARERGEEEFVVRAGDVHRQMDLENALPAVCSVLDGEPLRSAAGLEAVSRDGPPQGANASVRFRFTALRRFGVEAAEAMLRERFGSPIAESEKMIAFSLPDGKAIALQRDIAKVQLWVEDPGEDNPPPTDTLQRYAATQGRHSNLPGRLSHSPDEQHRVLGFPKPVLSVRAASAAELRAIFDWYQGGIPLLNRAALEAFKKQFLDRFPDFERGTFKAKSGGYFDHERGYKDRLIAQARVALGQSDHLSDEELGGRLLDLLTGPESGLLGWRTDARIKRLRAAHPGVFEQSAGELARSSEDSTSAVTKFVEQTWPSLSFGQENNLPYSESRNIPSMLAAFVRPTEAYGINTDPVQRMFRALFGEPAFGNQPLNSGEYERVLSMAKQLSAVMRDEWKWDPQDLWDVQGFIWVLSRAGDNKPVESALAEEGVFTVPATNLILYGPPGTGKTFATAYEAVRLCDGAAPADRSELKRRYDSLADAGQIGFVTFHQSYAYEDFVEGLRPTTAADDDETGTASAGFRLEARRGIFREIAALAEQARRTAAQPGGYDLAGRDFIKMSLGRAGSEDQIYDDAIEGGYIVLGYGGEVDWSDPRYESYQAVFDRWNEIEPGTSGNSGNIAQVWRFRSMKEGDLVIVAAGNSQFRAVGEVIGPYRYEPTGFRTYNHKRAVRWLLVLDDPLPLDTIYDGAFTMVSCYTLKRSRVKTEALSRLLPGAAPAVSASPDQFVLIIDEINRANISKVFGELITLLEPDKRLGEDNALRVKLPYSGESFGVPNNLHIIGTMNTADRSIALLDTALRRRFEFRELMPDPSLLPEDVDGIPLQSMLQKLNERIEYLFDREHQVGHAYFIRCNSKSDIDRTMRDRVIPLLQEYFYEDWSKVAQVLGDADGAAYFVVRGALSIGRTPEGDVDSETRYRWSIKPSFDATAYDQFR